MGSFLPSALTSVGRLAADQSSCPALQVRVLAGGKISQPSPIFCSWGCPGDSHLFRHQGTPDKPAPGATVIKIHSSQNWSCITFRHLHSSPLPPAFQWISASALPPTLYPHRAKTL